MRPITILVALQAGLASSHLVPVEELSPEQELEISNMKKVFNEYNNEEIANLNDRELRNLLLKPKANQNKKGGSGGGHGGGGSHGGGSSSGSSGSGSGSSGTKGGSSSGSSGSSGTKGGSSGNSNSGSSSGSSGTKGGTSGNSGTPKSNSASKGYGNDRLPSYSESQVPPPPYSASKNSPPSPQYATTSYGQTGARSNYWNGQYYPYSSFGYGNRFPVGIAAPLLFAGPFGFYGAYGIHNHNSTSEDTDDENAVVPDFYAGGVDLNNGTVVNGTYYSLDWDSGSYSVNTIENGIYSGGVDVGNNTYVNGTFSAGDSAISKSSSLNPNYTANGTILPPDTSTVNSGSRTGPAVLLLAAALFL